MPRKYRISEAGYYHCISRGVERRNVFLEPNDFDTFLSILLDVKRDFHLIVHTYCLMTNHYHILIETTLPNISIAMQRLNSLYSIYFNKKYKRSGHLWQGRFHSYYLYDDIHFWYVAKYIERNPIKALMVQKISEYPYQSLYARINERDETILNKSKIFDMTLKDYQDYISTDLSDEILSKIYDTPKVFIKDGKLTFLYKRLETFFDDDKDINRADNAKHAYEYGYTVTEIASFLGLSSTTVTRFVQ